MKRLRLSWVVALALTTALVVTAAIAGFAGSGAAADGDATLAPPTVQSPPAVTGTPERGSTLTTSNGTWNGTTPITYRYQWLRCDTNGGSCSNIGGATERTYELKNPDVGNTLRARVTASNSDGSASSTSVPTAVIRQAAPAPEGCAGNAPIPIASIAPPERLTVDRQTINPSVVGRSTQSVTVRFHVSCRGKSVQGALVYVTAVPFNQFSIPAEQATGADGWAQLTLNRLRGYPAARNQQLLVMFARARKGGEDLGGGAPPPRLVGSGADLRPSPGVRGGAPARPPPPVSRIVSCPRPAPISTRSSSSSRRSRSPAARSA